MDVPQLSPELREALRTWFHSKDRSVYLADNTFAYLPGGIGYLSMAFISETILSANVTSVTFSNIPQDFRHLLIITQARTDAAAEIDSIRFHLNNDTGNNYDRIITVIQSTGVTASATRGSVTAAAAVITEGANSRAFNFSPGFTIIFGYSIGTQEKDILSLSSSFGDLSADADLQLRIPTIHWRNKDVITSIVLVPVTGTNFISGSAFQLYGIL